MVAEWWFRTSTTGLEPKPGLLVRGTYLLVHGFLMWKQRYDRLYLPRIQLEKAQRVFGTAGTHCQVLNPYQLLPS